MADRTPLIVGNWKMNQDHHQATHLVQKLAWTLKDAKHDFDSVEVAVLPPFTDLRSVQTLVDADKLDIRYGAQDVSAHESGAYTGEISPVMLAKLGVTYVAIGHSERRAYHGEDEAVTNAKIRSAFGQGSFRSSASARASTSARPGTRSSTRSLRSTARSTGSARSRRRRSSSPTSQSGPSARVRSRRRRTRRRSAVRSARVSPSCTAPSSPTVCACCTAAPSSRATWRRSWLSPTSTGRSSAGHASTPRSSRRSYVLTR